MRILGLDTATAASTVALLDTDSGVSVERRDDPPPGARPRHTTRLLGLAAEALAEMGVGYAGVDLIAVGTGPGTFTGLRIGVASGRALAAARGIPIVGVSSLQALAAGAADAAAVAELRVLAVLDARRREVFAAGWSAERARVSGAQAHPEPRALLPAALAEELSGRGGTWLAVGDGAIGFRSVLTSVGTEIPDDESPLHRVSALQHCRLARGLSPGTPDEIEPDYLRIPDAELSRRGR